MPIVSPPVQQTVILAAGSGRRLVDANPDCPKPLLRVAGQPLLGHALDQAAAAGCTDAVVVVGYQASIVEDFLGDVVTPLRIRTVRNLQEGPNGLSLLAARPLAQDRFFLQMADHVFASPVLGILARVQSPLHAVLVDRRPDNIDLEDATKVRLTGTQVRAIGKRVEPWDAVDAGCFVLSPMVFDELATVDETEPITVSSGIRRLAARGSMCAVDLDGVPWMDVDTPADLARAEHLLTGAPPT